MKEKKSTDKTAVAKLREKFLEIKHSIKPSDELKEILRKRPEVKTNLNKDVDKKIAHPSATNNKAEI